MTKTFDDWLDKAGISGVSPEAGYAEDAWNAAILESVAQLTKAGEVELIPTIAGLDTGFRMEHADD